MRRQSSQPVELGCASTSTWSRWPQVFSSSDMNESCRDEPIARTWGVSPMSHAGCSPARRHEETTP